MIKGTVAEDKRIESNYKIHLTILIFLLFAGAALYTEEKISFYVAITGMAVLVVYIYTIRRISIIPIVITRVYTWWIVGFYLIIMFNGLFREIYAPFNLDYYIFCFIIDLLIIILFSNVPSKISIEIFNKSIVVASLLLCIYIIYNEFHLLSVGGIRIGESASGNVNSVAMFLGVSSVISIYKIIYEGKKIYSVPYLVQIIFILLTGSKNGLMFLIVGLVFISIAKYKLKIYKYAKWILFFLITVTLIIFIPSLYDLIGMRITEFLATIGIEIGSANNSHSTERRMEMITVGLSAFLQSPLIGNGWYYFGEYYGSGGYAHNNYIELLVSYGLLGLVFYYSIFIYLILKLWKKRNEDGYAILFLALFITWLISDNSIVTFYGYTLQYIIIIFGFKVLQHGPKKV